MPLRKTILLSFLLALAYDGWCQEQIAQVQGYVGAALFPAAKQNELFSGFNPGFIIGCGLTKSINHAFVFNPNLEFTAASREHVTFSLLAIPMNFKYYLMESTKIRPYVTAIGTIAFLNLHQQAYQTIVNPDPGYSVTDPSHVAVDQITYREPDLKLQFAPVFGLGATIGLDIPIRLNTVPFIQYSYSAYLTSSSSLINDNFKNNNKNLAIQGITAGIRHSLYRPVGGRD